MSDRSTGLAPSRLVAVLGPTNTGKTHLAVERMLGHASGMIGLPLRLLAREIYDRIVKLRGARAVALITGEEKIVPPRATYFVCTVEAMPLGREVEFLAVDEIQLCADPARGHVFTHRLLHARGKYETMFLGALTMAPLIRRLLPEAEFVQRERFSTLTYAGSKKLTRLPPRSAVVAFSSESVYAIAELIRRQRGGAAVVMGSLSPRTRNAQVALYQSGEVDFLVATDAIGMGLNMDVDHVAFAGLRKFDGKKTRWLHAQEIGQIAGRAGRYRSPGTFGVTGECPEIDEDLALAVEGHSYDPVEGAEWRNPKLDLDSLPDLLRSLAELPAREGLKLSEEALDETTLRALAREEEVARLARGRARMNRLWDVCQIPDFRKTTLDDHVRLARTVFEHLCSARGKLPDDWIAPQFKALDRVDGDIDALAGRLAQVRTLAYAANRPDWLHDPAHWQGRMRELEDRLSDTLHERLMHRFIDRRTSVLMRSLRSRDTLVAGVAADGQVTVEGCPVGRLTGLRFEPARGASALEDKALRGAAQAAVGPEVARRLGLLAADPDGAFSVTPDGTVMWKGAAAGKIVSGGAAPRVRLFGELGPEPARERAARRLEAYLAAERVKRLPAVHRLQAALEDGGLKGLARGVAYQLVEAGGVLDRRAVALELKSLSPTERRALKSLGVRFGGFCVWLPELDRPRARSLACALASPEAAGFRAPAGKVSPLAGPMPPRALAARSLMALGGLAVPVPDLEKLDALMRAATPDGPVRRLTEAARAELGWSAETAGQVLKALGFTRIKTPTAEDGEAWRAPRLESRAKPAAPGRRLGPETPFAVLAALQPTVAVAPDRKAAPDRKSRPDRRRKRAR
jgi:ATP-dependent RNA helicase SUPV3L1/SUV3